MADEWRKFRREAALAYSVFSKLQPKDAVWCADMLVMELQRVEREEDALRDDDQSGPSPATGSD